VSIPFSEGSRRYNIAPTQTIIAIVRDESGAPVARANALGPDPALGEGLADRLQDDQRPLRDG